MVAFSFCKHLFFLELKLPCLCFCLVFYVHKNYFSPDSSCSHKLPLSRSDLSCNPPVSLFRLALVGSLPALQPLALLWPACSLELEMLPSRHLRLPSNIILWVPWASSLCWSPCFRISFPFLVTHSDGAYPPLDSREKGCRMKNLRRRLQMFLFPVTLDQVLAGPGMFKAELFSQGFQGGFSVCWPSHSSLYMIYCGGRVSSFSWKFLGSFFCLEISKHDVQCGLSFTVMGT